MSGGLDGKVAIVTGGAGGIGQAIAAAFAGAGATVCVADLSLAAAEAVAVKLGPPAFGAALDVTRPDSIAAMVETVAGRAGGIDILANNAGLFDAEALLDITEASFDRVFAVNVRGLLFTLQAVARRMVAQGRGGSIVNLASGAGRRGHPASAVYCASKAGVISLTQSAALALAPHRIRVNALAPGAVDTAMWKQVDQKFGEQSALALGETTAAIVQATPWGRLGRPDDIAAAALFLASPGSDYVTSQTLNVDGGLFSS